MGAEDSASPEEAAESRAGHQNRLAPPQPAGAASAAQRGAAIADTHFKSLADLAPDGIAFHEDGLVLYANPALLRMLGATEAAQVIGKPTLDFVHPSSRGKVVGRIRQMLEVGTAVEAMEEVFLRVDGSPVDVEVVAGPCGGNTIMVHVRDIGRRKQAERELETTRRFLQDVVDICPNVIFVKDRQGRFVMVNEAMAQAHGSSHGALLGRTNAQAHPLPEFVAQHQADDLEVLRTGTPRLVEEPFVLPDGRRVVYQTVKTPIALPDGSRGILGVSADITVLKEAEASAQQLNQGLETRVAQRTAALASANQDLELRLDFERLMSEIVGIQASGRPLAWEDLIATVQTRLGTLLRADQVFGALVPKHWHAPEGFGAWARNAAAEHRDLCGALHAPELALLHQTLLSQQTVAVSRAIVIPPKLADTGNLLQQLQIGALLLTPIVTSGALRGYLGAARVDWDEAWSDDEISMLKTIAGVLSTALERLRADTARRQSEQRLATIVTSCPDAISISSLVSGVYVAASPAFGEVFGWPPEEVVGKPAVGVGLWPSAADRERLTTILQREGRVRNYEQKFLNRQGRALDALLSASLIEMQGEPCMLAITRDISHLKATEQLLNRQNAMREALARAQADFILEAEPKATFSRLLEHLLRASESEYGFIGEVLRDPQSAPYLRAFAITDISWDEASRSLYQQYVDGSFEFRNLQTLFGHVLATGRTVIANDPATDPRRGGLPAGHPPLHCFLGLPLFRGEHLVGMIGLANRGGGYDEELVRELDPFLKTCALLIEAFRNAQARRKAEDALRKLADELEHRVRERTEELQISLRELESFSYSVSHDLRSPLRSINGFAQALETLHSEALGHQGRDYLRRISQATLRMGQLIDDLLRLAQLTRAPLRKQTLDLSELARQVIAEIQATEPQRSVEISIAGGLVAEADQTLLRAVLENLLGNAWKFTRPRAPARIEFGRKNEHGTSVFFVRDNGVGFEMQYVHKIFEVFQRLHDAEAFPGTGVGLATVQRIVQRHGGKIWATGLPDRGACFFFTLDPVGQTATPNQT